MRDDPTRPLQPRREDRIEPTGNGLHRHHTFMGRPLALEHVQVQLPVETEAQLHTQGRSRRFMFGGGRPAQEDQPVPVLRADLQASDLLLPRLREPGHEHPTRIGLDQLFGDPQALCGRFGLHPHQTSLVEADMTEAGQVRGTRRSDDDHVLPEFDELPHRRGEHAPLRHRGLGLKDFRERAAGPAATGQFGVERSESAGDHRGER